MANYLKMANVQAIHVLRARGWSQRRIARELGVDRETVARYLRLAASAPDSTRDPPGSGGQYQPNLPAGSVGLLQAESWSYGPIQDQPSRADGGCDEDPPGLSYGGCSQNQPDPPAGSGGSSNGIPGSSGPESLCEPFRQTIIDGLERGLSAQRIWQDLKSEQGFAGRYDSVKRFIRRLSATRPLPFRPMECAPATEAQIDFGTGAPIVAPDGRRRKTCVFRIVLSHSRKSYSEVVFRQTTEAFLRCIENALWHFGGEPQALVIDNLKAAVTKADWYDPELNPKILAFCKYYSTAVLPTRRTTAAAEPPCVRRKLTFCNSSSSGMLALEHVGAGRFEATLPATKPEMYIVQLSYQRRAGEHVQKGLFQTAVSVAIREAGSVLRSPIAGLLARRMHGSSTPRV